MIQHIKEHKALTITLCAVAVACVVLMVVLLTHLPPISVTEDAPGGRIFDAGVLDDEREIKVHDSSGGEVVIRARKSIAPEDLADAVVPLAAPLRIAESPDAIWTEDTYAGNHTPVETAKMANGSLGVLTIPDLGLSVNVFESPDNMEAMSKGIAHFPSTSAFDGNVGMSGHNVNLDGSDGYFKKLYTLKEGASITYQTSLGERSYTVETVTAIEASDWSPLGYTDDHRLTLITCISGQPDKRLAVTAVETNQ